MPTELRTLVKKITGHSALWNILRAGYGAYWQIKNGAAIPLPHTPPPALKPPYVVAGVLRAASGVGESARQTIAALQKLGLDVRAHDVSALFGQTELEADPGWNTDWPETGTVIVHMNALEVPRVLLHLGMARMNNKRVIGAWAWELPQVPESWVQAAKYVHEIWGCSEYVANACKAITHIPVKAVLIPVQRPTHISQRDFGLPPGTFVVLGMGNAHSSLVRKNPFAAIEAFKKAFGYATDKILVLHIGRLETGSAAEKQLLAATKGAANIRIIRETLSDADRFALINRADAVISLHRAEGFGLLMAEAMWLAKPVIATRWSANLDFMTDESSALVSARLVPIVDSANIYHAPGMQWAEPDIAEAAAWLQKLQADPALRISMGARAHAQAERIFAPEHYRRQTGV